MKKKTKAVEPRRAVRNVRSAPSSGAKSSRGSKSAPAATARPSRTSASPVLDAFGRITKRVASKATELKIKLCSPAKLSSIAKAEGAFGSPLPSDYVAFLKHCDGLQGPLIDGLEFLSVEHAMNEYESMSEWDDIGDVETVGPVRPLFKHTRWWPITLIRGSSLYHCVDLDPAPKGHVGQVILVGSGDDERRVVSSSLVGFLKLLGDLVASETDDASDRGVELSDDAWDKLEGNAR